MSVIVETSLGDITIDLYTDERPTCCKNFIKLCKVKYYNFCLFHSVQRNFIAQTGDPTGTGKGGESINGTLYGDQARYFDWEFVPKIKHVKPGLVSMVNNGNDMHGSQFFITLGNSLDYLDGVHTVFGEVTEGLEMITKLNDAYCDEKFKPFRDIRIHHTIIIEDPFEDPPGLEMPDRSPSPTPEVIERARLAADADIDDFEGKTEEEIKEIMEEREEKANAQILEMIGDLPSTDITAPENILFVCKLNSVTTDEDLEIIFSRFGPIKSCEVIRDHKTGESLQYAFIEFEKKEDCESAYFKMDNVLIDDRRIHVDFSQSVSKIKWKGKGKGVETFSEDPKKSKLIIKDKSQRQDNNYDLVFEDDDIQKKSKKKHRERSHEDEDNNRHKKKQNYRSRSRSPVDKRRSNRSPDRYRRDDRGYRDGRRDRYSPPPRHREDRYRSPQRHRDHRHISPHRHRDYRQESLSRHRGYRQYSPQKHRDSRHFSPPRNRGDMNSYRSKRGSYSSPPKHTVRYRSPIRSREERHINDSFDKRENGRRTDKKKISSDEDDDSSLDRKKSKKKKKQHNSDEDDNSSSDRKKSKKKKKQHSSDEDDDSSLDRKKSKKKKKKDHSSDENDEKKKKKKKKQKDESSDEDKAVDKKRKKKKKQASPSEDEETVMKNLKKKHKNDYGDRKRHKSESDSPVHKKSDKHNSDRHREEVKQRRKEHRDRR